MDIHCKLLFLSMPSPTAAQLEGSRLESPYKEGTSANVHGTLFSTSLVHLDVNHPVGKEPTVC